MSKPFVEYVVAHCASMLAGLKCGSLFPHCMSEICEKNARRLDKLRPPRVYACGF